MTDTLGTLPSLNGLRVFEVAARHLNFRLAAEELGVTQGAVAQQVRGLEAELGVKLFERLPRMLALTGEGRSYVADVRRAFEIIAQATGDLRPQPVRLTISTTPTFASKWLIPRLPDFTARHPQLDLHILATERISSFQADGVDLAVRYGRPPFGPGLSVDLLFEQEIIAVCSPMLLHGRAPPATADELMRYTLLHDFHNFWPEFIEKHLGARRPRSRGSASARPRTPSKRRSPARASCSPTAPSWRTISRRAASNSCFRPHCTVDRIFISSARATGNRRRSRKWLPGCWNVRSSSGNDRLRIEEIPVF
jgi:LysR family glycine cleavage system transcriptional activator